MHAQRTHEQSFYRASKSRPYIFDLSIGLATQALYRIRREYSLRIFGFECSETSVRSNRPQANVGRFGWGNSLRICEDDRLCKRLFPSLNFPMQLRSYRPRRYHFRCSRTASLETMFHKYGLLGLPRCRHPFKDSWQTSSGGLRYNFGTRDCGRYTTARRY